MSRQLLWNSLFCIHFKPRLDFNFFASLKCFVWGCNLLGGKKAKKNNESLWDNLGEIFSASKKCFLMKLIFHFWRFTRPSLIKISSSNLLSRSHQKLHLFLLTFYPSPTFRWPNIFLDFGAVKNCLLWIETIFGNSRRNPRTKINKYDFNGFLIPREKKNFYHFAWKQLLWRRNTLLTRIEGGHSAGYLEIEMKFAEMIDFSRVSRVTSAEAEKSLIHFCHREKIN